MSRYAGLRVAVFVSALLATAPTAGDVGGCGTEAALLDRETYVAVRKDLDCDRCTECGLATTRCASACDAGAPPALVIPESCRPLFRDGEVCVRALAAASCDRFATFVDDGAPAVPTECEFCREAPR